MDGAEKPAGVQLHALHPLVSIEPNPTELPSMVHPL
jgi:hypothetical protein